MEATPPGHRDPAGGADLDSPGRPRRRAGGRRRLLSPPVPDHATARAPDHAGGHTLRPDLRLHRHDRDLRPDAGRTLRHHTGAVDAGLLHRHPGRRPRRGRCDRGFPVPHAAGRGHRLPAGRPAHGGDLMARPGWARRAAMRGGHAAVIGAFTLFTGFPFYWMLITMFKRTGDLLKRGNNPFIYNEAPTLENLRVLFLDTLYGRWLWNTALVGVLVVVIMLALALPAGYALARLAGRWGEQLGIAIFLTYLVPPTLLFIPLSRLIATLGLQDSLWSLVLVYPSFTVPFCTWLLMGFFKAIPPDVEEAAMIDGLSRLSAFIRVVVPISVAGILTVIIFSFTLVTQEFVYALTFISTASQYTVSVGVPTFLVRGDVYFWGSLMGACFLASVPIAILYNFFVDRFIAGFTVGAVK